MYHDVAPPARVGARRTWRFSVVPPLRGVRRRRCRERLARLPVGVLVLEVDAEEQPLPLGEAVGPPDDEALALMPGVSVLEDEGRGEGEEEAVLDEAPEIVTVL